MQFGNADTNDETRQQHERLWNLLRGSRADAPQVLDFARRWAETMEQLRVETKRPIWKLADLALARLTRVRNRLTDEQFEFALVALLECWGYQSGLRRWASEKGVLPRV